MIKVTFDGDKGITVPDNQTKFFVKEWVNHKNLEIVVSNQLFIYWLRVALKLGKISPSEIELYFKDKNNKLIKLEVNNDGRISTWPKGFCDEIEIALFMLSADPEELDKYCIRNYSSRMFDY